jgi:hypothetical protein
MELWMSEEIMADVGHAYMVTRKPIKEAVNEHYGIVLFQQALKNGRSLPLSLMRTTPLIRR